jgi:ribulokinase
MREYLVLGVDCGTQSLRAALYDTDGTLLAQASHAYATAYPGVNRAEQDPEDWWRALRRAVPDCLSQAGVSGNDIAAIACDGTSFTAVFCDAAGTPVRPALLWMDLRAADEATRVEETRDPVLDHCGRRVSAEWGLPKALWLQHHEPDAFNQAAFMVDNSDWLTYRLCGRWTASSGSASGKRHWTPQEGWPVPLHETLGIPSLTEKSPATVAYVGEPLGTLTPDAANALGLASSCIVTHGGLDGWAAPIGKNCLAEGSVSLTLGTSNILIAETASPKRIDGVMGPYPDGVRRGRAVYECGQASGGSIVGWYLSLIGIEPGSPAHAELEEQARHIPPGSEGLVVFDAWRGNRTPYFDAHARGTICGLTLEHGPAHLYRAVLEGCAYGLRNVFDTLNAGGHTVKEVRACGSGANNVLGVEIIAGVLGMPLQVSAEKQATCLGSAVCAAVAAGAHPDLETAAEAMAPPFETVRPACGAGTYTPCFEIYLETYRQMKDSMRRLSSL